MEIVRNALTLSGNLGMLSREVDNGRRFVNDDAGINDEIHFLLKSITHL